MVPMKDLFSLLATGEFANIALTKDSRGNIDQAEYGKLINHINLAVIELYKRFKFLEEELVICASPEVLTYHLRAAYTALPGNTTTELYIEHPDGENGEINIIEIKDVFDSDNVRLPMNSRSSTPYIKQKAMDTLRITGLTDEQKISVVFSAHPSLPVLNDSFQLNTCVLDIPSTIIEPIIYYVAARVFKPIGANNSTANADKSNVYQQQYELACQKIDMYGLIADDDGKDPDRFQQQGWL